MNNFKEFWMLPFIQTQSIERKPFPAKNLTLWCLHSMYFACWVSSFSSYSKRNYSVCLYIVRCAQQKMNQTKHPKHAASKLCKIFELFPLDIRRRCSQEAGATSSASDAVAKQFEWSAAKVLFRWYAINDGKKKIGSVWFWGRRKKTSLREPAKWIAS